MKGIQIGKEDIKLSLLIVYAEIQNNEPKILLKPISDYKIAGCTVNRQKLIAFLYTSNEQVEFQIANTESFTLVLQNMKNLGRNMK